MVPQQKGERLWGFAEAQDSEPIWAPTHVQRQSAYAEMNGGSRLFVLYLAIVLARVFCLTNFLIADLSIHRKWLVYSAKREVCVLG